MVATRAHSAAWNSFSVAVLLLAALGFYLPALARTAGRWPAPLDDTFIYFAHARSIALGHPFSWMPGHGYSSGATALPYPWLLAPAWALGLRGSWLGLGAAVIAVLGLFDLCRSLRRVEPTAGWLVAPLVVAIPLLDWSWFSGLETGWLGLVLGRALLACERALSASAATRPPRQLRAGAWLALLVLTRPETVVLAGALAVAVVHGARSLGTWPSLGRTAGVPLGALGARALADWLGTGEWSQAGAVRKLGLSDPFAEPATIAIGIVKNAVVLWHQAAVRALGGTAGLAALGALMLAAVVLGGRRRVAIALLLGAAGAFALVCLNTTAAYQNYRYAAPSLAMAVAAASIGAGRLARRRRPARTALALLLAGVLLIASSHELARQIDHFAQASANIVAQHAEVARRLLAMQPRPRRVLVNDAGAIPYLSGLPALDGLGLGGLRGLPFARASVHGPAAVIELIERLPPGERPDVLAIYPRWWPGLADVFGLTIATVHIDRNVICAEADVAIMTADWSTLGPADGEQMPAACDRLDVADLVSEREHGWRLGHGGWLAASTLRSEDGARRWDGGRIVPRTASAAFAVSCGPGVAPAKLWLRTDTAADPAVLVEQLRDGVVTFTTRAEVRAGAAPDRWQALIAPVASLARGDQLRLTPIAADLRLFQIWLTL